MQCQRQSCLWKTWEHRKPVSFLLGTTNTFNALELGRDPGTNVQVERLSRYASQANLKWAKLRNVTTIQRPFKPY